MPMTPKQIIRLLENNGFYLVRSNGSHRLYRNPSTNKSTIVPYHNRELKKGTEQNILNQAGLFK